MKEKIATAFVVTMYWLGCAALGAGIGYGVCAINGIIQEHARHRRITDALNALEVLNQTQTLIQKQIDEPKTEESEGA